ncbi:MAG: L,D-transpeptidase family protein [Ilumatobacter sp.]|uniref:L,D-transpeptidase family protein n=1 Tax=Ilumatobacter sp. TaxID=1967498 RepID=UPI0026017099|nr:L,D-transpeptidase family protein [Ilumatobacter sp.]MDJ0767617.1 L,D-transpeptidase family protein [Ilumatobacter sp.]
MQVKGGLLLAAAAAVVLPACATTSLASTPVQPKVVVPTTTTVAPTTVPVETTPSTEASTTTEATTPETTEPAPVETAPPPTTVPPRLVDPVDPPLAAVGTSSGADTERLQWRLLELGFWVEEADGGYDITTRQAVMAFQKYYGLTTDGSFGPETAAAMSAVTERPHARADAGTLIEIDKGEQLLYFIIDGQAEWILNASSGSEIPYEEPDQNTPGEIQRGDSVTRNGLHEVYRERAEGWWEGDLGEIYRPKYFTGGIAVHGSNNVPDYPASHGCVRVSVPAMDWIWEAGLMPLDTPVWVHEGKTA